MGSQGTPQDTQVDDLLVAGSSALASGDWTGARDAYRAALEVRPTAPVLEGMAAASWWLRDAAGAIELRRKAFRLYIDGGDPASAARVAISLVWDHIFRGERSIASGWVGRADDLLAGAGQVEETGWLMIVKAHLALMADRDPPEALRLAEEATALGRALGSRDVEMLALAYQGFALVSGGRVTEGMAKLDVSSTAAMSGELDGVNSTATVACCLIYACERVRDFGRAAEWCARLKEFSERWSFEFMIAICRTHYASTLVSQGSWQEAEEQLEEAIAAFGHSHRGQAAEALVRLAELRIRQGRSAEADELLDEVESGPPRMMGSKIALATRALLLLEGGRTQAGVDTAERFLRSIPDENSLECVSALEVLVQGNIALGNEEGARGALARLRSVADSVQTDAMRAAALFAQGSVAHAFGDPVAARAALEDASDLFDGLGAPYEGARARLLLARCLLGAGHGEAAVDQAGRALQAAQTLGAEGLLRATRELHAELGSPPGPPLDRFPGLTSRETEVLRLIAQGHSNQDIADRLVLSVRTVERHISNIYLKLGLEGPAARASATATAHRHGL